MQRLRDFLSTSFGSALTGGLVVAVAGLIAIEAGLVGDDDDGSGSLAAPPLTRPAADGAELSAGEIYRRYSDGVVFIQASGGQQAGPLGIPRGGQGTATGSGFVIDDDGHILTNAHVVEGATEIEVQAGDEGDVHSAEVVGMDPSSDVALLKVEETDGLTPLELGDSSKVQVGDAVVAIGNPFGLDRTVTTGIVSAKQRLIRAPNGFSISDVIQTDAAVNPGNSGGPLLDSAGRVIGINSQIATSGGGNEGVAFAVPIETARDVADQLIDDGSVERAYIGISGGSLTPEAAEALNVDADQGVLVESVVQNGPAADAGIEGADGEVTVDGDTFPAGGDVVTELDGEPLAGMDDLIAAVNEAAPGDRFTLTVIRDDSERRVDVALGRRPAQIADAASDPRP
ncbi:MAG: S1C family serine protease [Solirubrobacterales bacterium]